MDSYDGILTDHPEGAMLSANKEISLAMEFAEPYDTGSN